MSTHPNSARSLNEQIASGKTSTFRRAIHALLKASGGAMTDRQIMEALHEPDVNNIRPEITRLKQDGLIEELADKVVCEVTRKRVRSCRVTLEDYFDRHARPKREKRTQAELCLK